MLIAARITEISEWIDRSDVREMKARNAAIGIRTIDYSKIGGRTRGGYVQDQDVARGLRSSR